MIDSNQNDNLDGWEPCPEGALAGSAAADAASQNRRNFLIKAALGVFLGAAGCRAYINSRDLNPGVRDGAMTCVEVKANLAGFVRDKLDAKLHQRIVLHVSKCNGCSVAHRNELDALPRVTEMRQLSERMRSLPGTP